MNDILKWCGKVLLQGVLWVFILSIRWDGQSLFSRASDIVVHNALVETLDSELADLWSKVAKTARMTFSQQPIEETRSL